MSDSTSKPKLKGRKLDVLCYIEGVSIPIKSIYLSTQVGIPTTVTISTIHGGEDIIPTTHVAIFYAYLDGEKKGSIRDKYKLLFHGEVSGTRMSKTGISIDYQILAVDSRTYLNRLPDKMWPVLYQQNDRAKFYPEFANDAAFLGLNHDRVENYVRTVVGAYTETKDYTLREYVGKILKLMGMNTTGYKYYSNADQRYRIRHSHHTIDPGDTFKALFGVLKKSSMIHNMNTRLYETSGTTLDALSLNLVQIGYNYTSVVAPKYSPENGGAYYEYLIMRDMINHRSPKFNFILLDEGDQISITSAMPSVTATKYKYKTARDSYPLENTIFPAKAMSGGKLKMTDDETIYGIKREIQEMDWFYRAFIESVKDQLNSNKTSILYQKQQFEFLLKRTGRNSIGCSKRAFIPDYVLGMPSIIYDPITERCYRGNIWKISYGLNMEGGNSSTSIELVNTSPMNMSDADKEGELGVNPMGKDNFASMEVDFYKKHFYDNNEESPLLSADDIAKLRSVRADDYYKFIERDHCTLTQYMQMHYGDTGTQQNNIPDDLLLTFNAENTVSPGSDTSDRLMDFVNNSLQTLKDGEFTKKYNGKPTFEFMFIKERRKAAESYRGVKAITIIHGDE